MKLSIVIPCFNSEVFLVNTLNMILEQDSQDIEVILIDDGSTDRTLEIAKNYEESFHNLIIIHKNNEGVAIARNVGISRATGDYIYFLDSDDKIAKNTINYFLHIINEEQFDFYAFGYRTEKNNEILKNYMYNKFDNQVLTAEEVKKAFLLKQICFHICSCLFNRHFIDEHNIRFTEGALIGEDIEFILKTMNRLDRMKYYSRCCFFYQQRTDSATMGHEKYTIKQFGIIILLNDFFSENEFIDTKIKNFFLANLYFAHLVSYLKSNEKDLLLEKEFYKYKFLINQKMEGPVIRLLFIRLLKIINMHLLFKCKK